MWIRSQDRKRLVKVAYVSISHTTEKQICGDVGVANEGDFILGEYSSKERALEVLDNIQQRLIMGSSHDDIINNRRIQREFVFIMPEE